MSPVPPLRLTSTGFAGGSLVLGVDVVIVIIISISFFIIIIIIIIIP